ncbi:hypothetical protein [Planktothrix agardhii]|uniref:hypothetical protein n=1 Tax=Planktothrix agardhii TaxID=1160 RepID=UPI002B213E16|nr:hypothetical protein [Planktothrix agardhii]MEA5563803.1 hypothetical protein [Planktothrix agardhii UHCC 0887]
MAITKAKTEGINQKIVRADIRIPVTIYSQLEAIAVSKGSKAHHITGRPMVSPIILEVLELGLRHWESEKSSEGDSVGLVSDTVQGNQYDIETIKGELLDQLRGELQTLADTIAEKK